jgi:MerR family mercuric resistance operon transcriptional regulator
MAALTISELARAGGVGVETVRYYQRRGLLDDPRPARGHAPGRRHYGDDDARRLRFVRAAQRGGFTLEEIGKLIELDRTDDRAQAREMARLRIAALDAEIAALEAARSSLGKLAKACAGAGKGPCPILAAFDS